MTPFLDVTTPSETPRPAKKGKNFCPAKNLRFHPA
jgi:hypothetical protein